MSGLRIKVNSSILPILTTNWLSWQRPLSHQKNGSNPQSTIKYLPYSENLVNGVIGVLCRTLLEFFEYYCVKFEITCNAKKTVIFKPGNRYRWISNIFPGFTKNGCELSYVSKMRYLVHVINDVLKENDDIN